MSERHRKVGCPGTRELELYCIGELAAARNCDYISAHIKTCPRCAKRLQNLHTFYTIFKKELEQPIKPVLLDFCKQRSYHKVRYGLLVCRAIPEKDQQHKKAYLATLTFSANGDGSKRCLAEFELTLDQIGVMLYSDPRQNELLMFLCSTPGNSYAPCLLSAPGLFEKVEFNISGVARIPLTSFEHLNNRLIYFTRTVEQPYRSDKILEKVQEMIF